MDRKDGQLLAVALRTLRTRSPYIAPLLALARFRLEDRLEADGTDACVDSHGVVYIQPKWLRETNETDRLATIMHEVGHIIDRSLARKGDRDNSLWNLATDLSINSSVLPSLFSISDLHSRFKGVFPDRDFKLPVGQPAEWYYKELLKKQLQSSGGGGGSSGGSDTRNTPSAPPDLGGDKYAKPGDDKYAPTEGDVRDAASATAQAMQNGGKTSGSWSGLLDWCKSHALTRPIDWRKHLRMALGSDVAAAYGGGVASWGSRSLLQASIGDEPGCAILPGTARPRGLVYVAVDTSGSMLRDLSEVFAEVESIVTKYADVYLVTCDTSLGDIGPIRRNFFRSVSGKFVGGGGTSFLPPFEFAQSKRDWPNKKRPKLMVYMTDGYGSFPATPIPGMRTIWLRTRSAIPASDFPFGKVITIGDET